MHLARKLLLTLALASLPAAAGCNANSTSIPPPFVPSFVYYTTDDGARQMGIVAYPITATSTLATMVNQTAAFHMAFDASGRLFVVHDIGPGTINVFTPPLTATSTPSFVLTYPAGNPTVIGIAFDSSGNLWASQGCNVEEFTPPFTSSVTLAAAVTLTSNFCASGIAFDPSGNLWVAIGSSTNGIEEFVKGSGFTNSTPIDHTLTGVNTPFDVAFDRAGNLYSSGTLAAQGVAMWNANNLGPGATPNVLNHTGLSAGFSPQQLAFDPFGNLYVADCGTTAKIYVYPTATTAFSTTLAPVVYSDANIVAANCVEGIAIH
jgi:sugar lactone lactonase YvrE